MKSILEKLGLAAMIFGVICGSARIYAVNLPEKPLRYVVDLADIIEDAVETQLNRYLRELEQKTTAQMVVLTIPSLEGQPIESFSIEVAHDRWKLGQKNKDNGLLLTVALQDKQYRIEVGYGLEGIIPDSLAGSIGRRYLVPFFRKGDYSAGIFSAVVALADTVAKDAGVSIEGMAAMKPPAAPDGGRGASGGLSGLIIFFIFLMFVLAILGRRRAGLLGLFLLLAHPGSRTGAWRHRPGHGGFGGGGFGGFSGGGGGFGGGGASGSW